VKTHKSAQVAVDSSAMDAMSLSSDSDEAVEKGLHQRRKPVASTSRTRQGRRKSTRSSGSYVSYADDEVDQVHAPGESDEEIDNQASPRTATDGGARCISRTSFFTLGWDFFAFCNAIMVYDGLNKPSKLSRGYVRSGMKEQRRRGEKRRYGGLQRWEKDPQLVIIFILNDTSAVASPVSYLSIAHNSCRQL
jgi:hypothetical protein